MRVHSAGVYRVQWYILARSEPRLERPADISYLLYWPRKDYFEKFILRNDFGEYFDTQFVIWNTAAHQEFPNSIALSVVSVCPNFMKKSSLGLKLYLPHSPHVRSWG